MILDVHAELLSMSLQHTVSQEVELDVLVLPPPVIVLAVDDFGLLRMKLQSAFGKATPDGFHNDRASSSLLQWTIASSA